MIEPFSLLLGASETHRKFSFAMYFFPMFSSAYVYFKYSTITNLVVLLTVIFSVICLTACLFAHISASSKKDKDLISNEFPKSGLFGKVEANFKLFLRFPHIILFGFAWLMVYVWTAYTLTTFFKDISLVILFIAQVGLFFFNWLRMAFEKRILRGLL